MSGTIMSGPLPGCVYFHQTLFTQTHKQFMLGSASKKKNGNVEKVTTTNTKRALFISAVRQTSDAHLCSYEPHDQGSSADTKTSVTQRLACLCPQHYVYMKTEVLP